MTINASSENLQVFRHDEGYRVQTSFSHTRIGSASSASQAIDLACAALVGTGGEIVLGRGGFELDEPLLLPDRVTLAGGGRATRLSCLSGDRVVGVTGGRECQIRDLAVVSIDGGSPSGVVIEDAANCVVRDVLSAGFAEHGFVLRDNTMLTTLRGCHAAGNTAAGITLRDLHRGRYGDFVPNLVDGCTVWDGGVGIELANATVANIGNCIVYQTHGDAYHLSKSNSVAMTGCRSFQITGNAVTVVETNETNITGNIFCWHTEHGIEMRGCMWGTVTGNEIIDTGSWNCGLKDFSMTFADLDQAPDPKIAVWLADVDGMQVVGNSIFNWPCCPKMKHGVYEDKDCRKNGVHHNNINHFESDPVVTAGAGSEATGNTFDADTFHPASPDKIQSFRHELTRALTDETISV